MNVGVGGVENILLSRKYSTITYLVDATDNMIRSSHNGGKRCSWWLQAQRCEIERLEWPFTG